MPEEGGSKGSSHEGGKPPEPPEPPEPPDGSKKRARGPSDCLDWSESDEEVFTPFTQAFTPTSPPPKKVFRKKASVKKSGGKKAGGKAKSKSSSSSVLKGKSLGKFVLI